MNSLSNAIAHAEKGFNYVGYVPFVSKVSGSIRAVAGVVTMVAASIFSIIKGFEILFRQDKEKVKQCRREAKDGVNFAINGVGNIVRGVIECIPFVGNAAGAIYDFAIKARIAYPKENANVHNNVKTRYLYI